MAKKKAKKKTTTKRKSRASSLDDPTSFKKASKGRGRPPSKPSKKLTDDIAELIFRGNYVETACAIHCVNRKTMLEWMKRGHKEGEAPEYAYFLLTVGQAMAAAEKRDLDVIDGVAQGTPVKDHTGRKVWRQPNWSAAAWRLERRHPKKWGRKVNVDMEDDSKDKESAFKDQSLNSIIADALDECEADGERWED